MTLSWYTRAASETPKCSISATAARSVTVPGVSPSQSRTDRTPRSGTRKCPAKAFARHSAAVSANMSPSASSMISRGSPRMWCASSWARVNRTWPSGKSLLARMSAAGPLCTHSPSTSVPSRDSATSTAKCCSISPARSPSAAGQLVAEQSRLRFGSLPPSKQAAQRQGRELAELTRRELDLGSDALGDLAGLIEQHFAVDVALSRLGTEVDGLCVHSGPAALILASSDFPEGHVRFTLAHELAHHILGDPREIIEEAEGDMFADTAAEWRANAFAGHFLVPERGVRSVLDWLGETPGTVTERAAVALIEHFGVSLAALVYQLNVIGVLSYSAGQQLRGRGVAALLALHRDVAPTGAAAGIRRTRRSPERLTRRALSAAREQRLGLSVVASLLERDDDQWLWNEVMAGQAQDTADPGIVL